MSLRVRLIVSTALAVTVAIALVSGLVYLIVSAQLHKQLDTSLKDRAAQATAIPKKPGAVIPPCFTNITAKLVGQLGGPGYFQIVSSNGTVSDRQRFGFTSGTYIPVTSEDRAMTKAKHRDSVYSNSTVVGNAVRIPVRVYTVHLVPNCALQVARPLQTVTSPLRQLAVALFAVGLGGVGLAAALGWAIAGTALAPVRHLTRESEYVARTRDLSRRIEARGSDELARLAGSFNTMLEALEISLKSQRQLVADASHELRTPLTTAKTNIEVLRRAEGLPKEEQDAILHDVGQQIDELAVLVTDIVDLARGVEPNLETEEVRLDLLVAQAVERARRLSPKSEFKLNLEPCLVNGVPSRLERAVANLLDNAVKWNPPGESVEVTVSGGNVSVRDHGKGIDDADLPFVFDRFYRASAARALPGSGLGLAIVRQVAESHRGRVTVERPDDGGALLTIVLPCID